MAKGVDKIFAERVREALEIHVDLLEYLRYAEIGTDSSDIIQVIVFTTNLDWDAVAGNAQRVDLSTPTQNDPVGDISAAGFEVLIAKTGRYEVAVFVDGFYPNTANNWAQLVRNGSGVLDVAQFNAGAGTADGNSIPLFWQGSLIAGDTLDVRLDGNNAVGASIQAYAITMKELPVANAISISP